MQNIINKRKLYYSAQKIGFVLNYLMLALKNLFTISNKKLSSLAVIFLPIILTKIKLYRI